MTPISVLLIEDNSGDAHLIRDMLAREKAMSIDLCSFDLLHVDHLRAGLTLLETADFDLVLLDLSLPDSQGLDTFNKLYVNVSNLPIVLLTGSEDELLAVQAVHAGAQDYLVKGHIDSDGLVRAIRYAIERQRMVTMLAQRAQALQASEARLRKIIARNTDGILIVDAHGTIHFVNPAAEDLLGHKAARLKGTTCCIPVAEPETREIKIHRGEDVRMVEIRTCEIEWEGKMAYLASLRDVTEQHRMRTQLERAQQHELELKDQFLSHVSHEIRTPLACIYQFVTILLDGLAGDLSPDQREYLQRTFTNVNQLRKMIGDLMDVTRTQTGKLTVDPYRISTPVLLRDALNTFSSEAAEKNITLQADFADHLPPVLADPDRLRQILTNLISNSIKFTPAQGTVALRAHVDVDNPHFLCVAVADNGCGIRPEDREGIFDRLYQSDTPCDASRKGLGLGLYICKELVSRHGGRIWVDSQLGHGSTFNITMPIFSLANLLAPILSEKNYQRGCVTLITVDIHRLEKGLLRRCDASVLAQVRQLLERCILPDLDVLLPRMAASDEVESLFVVACADQPGAEVLGRRMQEQLQLSKALQIAGVESVVSYTSVAVPTMANGPSREQWARTVTGRLEDLLCATLGQTEKVAMV